MKLPVPGAPHEMDSDTRIAAFTCDRFTYGELNPGELCEDKFAGKDAKNNG